MQEPVDTNGFDADRSNDLGSPPIEALDSDDALWSQLGGHEPAPPPGPDAVFPPRSTQLQVTTVTSHSAHVLPDRRPSPLPNLDLTKTPFYSDLLWTLRNAFGLRTFRPNQLEACTASMQGHDVFVLMPTGGGKSLCFQLPAVVKNAQMDGVTVVISPLVSLMHDQVSALRAKGVKVACFVGDQTSEEANNVHQMLKTPRHRPAILYATPEKLDKSERLKNDLQALYEAGLLVRIVADEAHCIVTWGRNFRDSYKDFTWIRDRYPSVPVIALTATANKQAIQDIIARLRMRNCVQYAMSFNRPNLLYEVRERGSVNVMKDDIARMINSQYRGKTGIIYYSSRDKCETFAKQLRKAGIVAEHYHASLPVSEKERVQQQWQAGHVKVIVATIAFGMGIDKPDVRFVIHCSLPNSLSDYYQETGRAGRDGLPSDCILYYHYSDAHFIMRRAREEAWERRNADHADNAIEHIRRVVQYCLNAVNCRRQQVLAYFDEQFDPEDCHDFCDNCKDKTPAIAVDVTEHAVRFVNLVQQAQQAGLLAARGTLIKAFLGKLDPTRNKGYDQLQVLDVDIAKSAGKELVERLHDHLIARGILVGTTEPNKFTGYTQDCTRVSETGRAYRDAF
ncbi:uncharacterized protein PHACADRAFT_95968 [Phanerochaete carnosa HHB-10118-sp]|uniref:ATP-dependent DNA helicase n=1 Tax=Phanerochaete carnosa (strain HHB-10118-sp) TaxID=650164 RepID=K5VW82_PHACS|nr:uncharacterized protein PHACADRAFT_95968 [Phanerochaete carnosa HHB-10118-sp]EKM55793.1 hypothetical protein PHACADRAFT_95968 [Phanerochaete carnosa HHB-10118-sp]